MVNDECPIHIHCQSKLPGAVALDIAAPLMERFAHGFEAFRILSGKVACLGEIVVELERLLHDGGYLLCVFFKYSLGVMKTTFFDFRKTMISTKPAQRLSSHCSGCPWSTSTSLVAALFS